ncbi:MAG: hypothetical protein HQL00_07090 [Nitrospirae bacterium]|nr:hypothetical protein [Nitrospirota bacterium]
MSWLKWGDILVDTFTWTFFVPLKLANGAVLYKDIYNNVGILPPYLCAFLFKALGKNNYTIIYLSSIITLTGSFMLYKLSRFFLNRLFSTLLSINFLFIFAFNNLFQSGIANFIMPYRISATLFFLFVLASTLFFMFFLYSDKAKYIIYWSLALWCAFLCRVEMAVTVWGAFLFIGICLLYKKRITASYLLYFIMPILLTILSYGSFLYFNNAFAGFKTGIIDFVINSMYSNTAYAKWVSGYDKPWKNIFEILISTLSQVTALGIVIAISDRLSKYYEKIKDNSLKRKLLFISVTIYTILIGQLLTIAAAPIRYKILNVIFICTILTYLYKLLKTPSYNNKQLMLLSIFIVSFTLTIRIFLDYTPLKHGFFLLPMSLICYYIFYIKIFPSLYNKTFGTTDLRYYYISAAILIVQLSLPSYFVSYLNYTNREITVNTIVGQFNFINNDRTHKVMQAARYLVDKTPKNSTLVVFPEGISINVLAQRDNPLPYTSFLPLDVETIGEDKLIKSIADKKIDYIAVLNSSTEECGYDRFQSYAKDLYRWIIENYTLDYVAATPLKNNNVQDITTYNYTYSGSVDIAVRQNYKVTDLTVLVFKRK